MTIPEGRGDRSTARHIGELVIVDCGSVPNSSVLASSRCNILFDLVAIMIRSDLSTFTLDTMQ